MPGTIDAVIFDLDDTLIDWSNMAYSLGEATRPHVENLHRYLMTNGHAVPELDIFLKHYRDTIVEDWQQARETWAIVNFTESIRRCFQKLALEIDKIDFEAALYAFDWQPMPGVTLYEDTIEVLDALQAQGYKIGLITNSMMPMWMRDIELEAYGLLDYFDARITSGDAGYIKPHTAIYQHCLDLLETTADQAVFVGDRPANDIAGANAIGMISVLMDPPHLNYELNGTEPNYTITQLRQLLPILASLEANGR